MNLTQLLDNTRLDRSVLIGYYGGGNYGDELLLEVLCNLFTQRRLKNITITYQQPQKYDTYHHNFGYTIIPMYNKWTVIKNIRRNKNIIVGGGGLWGMDVNPNILLLSCLLWVSRWLFGKKVYLVGVGYYGSTSRLGHLSARLAAKAANHIVARDDETLRNFSRYTSKVGLDTDIAWHIPQLPLDSYATELAMLEKTIPVRRKTVYITLRRFKKDPGYSRIIQNYVAAAGSRPIIIALLEPRDVDPDGFALATNLATSHPNVTVIDFTYNPLLLYLYFKKHHSILAVVGPQFHIIITAHLAGVPFLPIVYDNKVAEVLRHIGGQRPIALAQLQQKEVTRFVDNFYGSERTA